MNDDNVLVPRGNPYHELARQAVTSMPSAAQLGGEEPLPWVRFPFYPTAPWYSTNPNVGFQTRNYKTQLLASDQDYVAGSTAVRQIRFDRPVRIIARNGGAVFAEDPIGGGVDERNMNLLYRVRMRNAANDNLDVEPAFASLLLGTNRNPGELGGHGYPIDQGGTLVIEITPLVDGLDIDIVLVVLEIVAPRNFSYQTGY
jgi:hypothetical protein